MGDSTLVALLSRRKMIMIKDGYFIDVHGERYKIYTDSYGHRYIEKNGRSFLI